MPQLDKITFYHQLLTIAILFFSFFVFFTVVLLPKIFQTRKLRFFLSTGKLSLKNKTQTLSKPILFSLLQKQSFVIENFAQTMFENNADLALALEEELKNNIPELDESIDEFQQYCLQCLFEYELAIDEYNSSETIENNEKNA